MTATDKERGMGLEDQVREEIRTAFEGQYPNYTFEDLINPKATFGARKMDRWTEYALTLAIANTRALLLLAQRLDEK